MKKIYLAAIYIALAFALDIVVTGKCHAQDAATQAAVIQAQAAQPQVQAAVVAAPAAPAVVSIPEPAAPPQWATDLLFSVSKLPVIGPLVSKAMLYLGILAALLTTLVGASLSIIAALQKGFNSAGLLAAANAVANFKAGKIMYWLTYFSNFNAKKPS